MATALRPLPLRMELGHTTTAEGVRLFRGEVERGTTLIAATEWTEHPTRAIGEGHDLLRVIRTWEEFTEAA